MFHLILLPLLLTPTSFVFCSQPSEPNQACATSQFLINEFVRRKNQPSLGGVQALAAKGEFWAKLIKNHESDFAHFEAREIASQLISELDLSDLDIIMRTCEVAKEYGLLDHWDDRVSRCYGLLPIYKHEARRVLVKYVASESDELSPDFASKIYFDTQTQQEERTVFKNLLNLFVAAHTNLEGSNDTSRKITRFAQAIFSHARPSFALNTALLFDYIEDVESSDLFKNSLCVYLFSKKHVITEFIISDAVLNKRSYEELLRKVPFMSYSNFVRLTEKYGFNESPQTYQDYIGKIRLLMSDQDIQQEDKKVGQSVDLMNLPNDIFKSIIAYSPVFELLYVLPLTCKALRGLIKKDFILSYSHTYPRFINERARQNCSSCTLYPFHFVHSLFDTFHDLIKYQFVHDQESVEPIWFKFIAADFSSYKSLHELLKRSVDLSLNFLGWVFIHDSISLFDPVELYDVAADNEAFTNAIANNTHMKSKTLRLILKCKNGGRILRGVIASKNQIIKSYIWSNLVTVEEGSLSSELVVILSKYNQELGLENVCVPFRAIDIMANVDRLTSSDVCVSARIVKAFAEVGFVGMPIMQVSYNKLIYYFITHPKLLSVDQFTGFISWLKSKSIVKWNNEVDQCATLLGSLN
jgi:hypothetical protein